MKRHFKEKTLRSCKGLSLIEMLTAMMLTGFIAAATCDMMAALTLVSLKADNQLSSSLQCKRALDTLGVQIRAAHNLKSAQNSQTLTLTVPVMQRKSRNGIEGMPIKDEVGNESVDQYLYETIADPNRPYTGEFILKRTLLKAGRRNSFTDPCPFIEGQSQIVLKGIIGPLDLGQPINTAAMNYPPKVFTYLSNLPNPSQTLNPDNTPEIPAGSLPMSVSGVAIQVEIQPSDNPNKKVRSTTFGLRSEYFARSSSYVQ
jgi:hypothetical protein